MSLREVYSEVDPTDARNAEAQAAIAEAATDAHIADSAVDTRTYVVDDASGDRIVLRETEGGWPIDDVTVQVSQAVCEALAESAR